MADSRAIARTFAINVGGSVAIRLVAGRFFPHGSPIPILLGGAVPAYRLVRTWRVAGMLGVVPALVLLEIAGVAALAAVFHGGRPLLVGSAIGRLLVGAAFALSVVVGKPLIASMARVSAGRDAAKRRAFDDRLARASVRARYVRMTFVWAAAYGALGAVLLAAAWIVPLDVLAIGSTVSSYAVLASLLWYNVRSAQRASRSA